MNGTDPLGLIGNSFGGYNVAGYCGSGAFAYVYRATQPGTTASVALKILNPRAGAEQMLEFENEGTLLFKLSGCRAVVDIIESSEELTQVSASGGVAFPVRLRFHVLRLADGCLDELVADVSALDWPSRLSLLRNLVLGVHQMHGKGLVHRDLKAANSLLFLTTDGVEARVADLGRSRDLAENPQVSPRRYQSTRGDPNFAPPELLWALGEDRPIVHRCADLYGLGSLLFELTLGQSITAIALFPHSTIFMADYSLDPQQRLLSYRSRIPEIRSWFEPSFELFEAATPASLRPQAGQLIRQLCDPDPMKRLPQTKPGRRGERLDGLNWLLRRVDILRLTLNNNLRQQQRVHSQKRI